MIAEHWWNVTDREKPLQVLLCPPQIQYSMAWNQTWTSTVTGQQPTTCYLILKSQLPFIINKTENVLYQG